MKQQQQSIKTDSIVVFTMGRGGWGQGFHDHTILHKSVLLD